MADPRDRDLVYERDRSRADPYAPRRVYRSPSHSPSPDRLRYERRAPARFHDDLDSESGRSRRFDDYHPRRNVYHREDPRFSRPPPPPRAPMSPDYEPRREPEPERDYFRARSPSPVPLRRPTTLRRQSSLDTYDRPLGNDLHFLQREEYGPPARREDVLASYGTVPVEPRSRPLRGVEFRDDESLVRGRPFPPPLRADHDRVKEREVVRVGGSRKSRDGESVTSKTLSRTSGTSSDSSRDSSPSRATSVRSEYPKKGKTKIPSRLVSKRALIDLGYPFLDEGKTVIILKALGQDQIDQVLKVSEEYKKAELEVSAARSSSGNLVDDRRDEIYSIPPPPPPASHHARDVEVVDETLIRNVSPSSRSYTTSASTYTGGGQLALRPRSRSRSGREIRSEIKALEAQLHAERRHRRRRSRSGSLGGELMRIERTADGQQIILSEERVEKVDEGYRGPRIERDRRGRLSLSVPKRR